MKCYLSPSDVTYTPKKKFTQLSSMEKIESANEKRNAGKAVLSTKDYSAAATLYNQAVFMLNTIDNDKVSDNHERAALLECMIACLNNAAFCYLQMKEYREVVQQSRNAMLLIDAIETKRGGKVHGAIMRFKGMSDMKLFVEWRTKAIIYCSTALAETNEPGDAVELLKRGIATTAAGAVAGIPGIKLLDGKVKKLMVACKQRKDMADKKEKKAAMKMFGGPAAKTTATEPRAGEQLKNVDDLKSVQAVRNAVKAAPPPPPQKPASLPAPPSRPDADRAGGGGGGKEEEEEGGEAPWYEEHFEAMVLGGVVGAIAVGFLAFGRRR